MSNYDGKIELPQMYNNQGEEQYVSSDKSDTYLWLAEENTKQAKQVERLQAQLKEANEIISIYRCYDDTECGKATEYCKKWSVK